MAPENRPPLPIPAIALPTMRALLVGAVAQTSDLDGSAVGSRCSVIGSYPTSKRPMAIMNTILICDDGQDESHETGNRRRTLKIVYILPKVGCNAVEVNK